VDLDRLWYTVRVSRANGAKRLMVTHSGATPLEQVFFAKMVLFTTVYHHHKVRAFDCMFAGIIEYMVENGITIDIRDKVIKWDTPADYLWLTDGEMLSFGFRRPESDTLHRLVHNLFFRRPLVRALVISRRTIGQCDDDRYDELQRHAKKSPTSAKARRQIAEKIWRKAGKPCLRQEVWLDLPELPSSRAADETFVLPAETEGVDPIPLNEVFPTGRWTSQYGLHKWRGHVFCPPEHRDSIALAAQEVLEDDFQIEVLPEAFRWCKVTPPRRRTR
jgi:HD superfamily phosphohydrolase